MMINNEQIESCINEIRNRPIASLRAAALKVLTKKPLFDVEVASSCNATCVFCPRNAIKRQTKLMSQQTFDHVLKILPTNANVMFAGLGEPLLNKNLATYIEKLSNHNVSCCIVTNGLLLTQQRQQELIAAGISQFQVSYSSIDKKTLQFIMGNDNHNDIVNKNLKHLAQNRPADLRVQLNFILMEQNENELQKVTDFAQSLGFDIYVRRVHTRGGNYSPPEENIKSSCGICAAVTFITSDGKIISCSNDTSTQLYFKAAKDTNWPEIIAWKKNLILQDFLFPPCLKCNDDYRWFILDYLSVNSNKTRLE